MKTLRIFISSPGDVVKERERAREVVESLRRRYSRHFLLQPVLWEDLPLQPDMSFQHGIDAVLSEKGVDIAIFILWSRLGSPLGHSIPKPDGSPYRSGTEREYDLIIQARATALEKEGKARPHIVVYTRSDDASFEEALRNTTTTEKEELIRQKKLVESFLTETFRDQDTGDNIGAFFPFDRPVTFSQRLRTHLQSLLDLMAGESTEVIWDTEKQGPPFLGLEAFQPWHAPVFFGREEEILEARHALKEQARNGCAFLLLSGASGSGKSSLARAGVLPAIVELELDEHIVGWRSLVLTPSQLGPDPIAALVVTLAADDLLPALREGGASLLELIAGLKKDPDLTFNLRIKSVFTQISTQQGGSVRLLLVIDQLEELFTTSVLSAADRSAFLAVIETFARSGSVWILATARSDFYQAIQSEPSLVRMKSGHGQFDVLPPGPDALQRIIEEPARLAGLTFEIRDDQSLANRIIKDSTIHSELLPLVEFVLRELYEKRRDARQLDFATYESLGGVEGALVKCAEDTYAALPGDAQESLAAVLQALVTLEHESDISTTAGEKLVRQRASNSDFDGKPAAKHMVDAFIAARLFTTCRHEATGEPAVTIAHESLVRVWPRAAAWTDNNRDFLRTRARIAARMKEGSPLLKGDPLLETAKSHLYTDPRGFNAVQRAWIEQAVVTATAKERQATLLRRLAYATLSILTVLSLASSVWAIRNERVARRDRITADLFSDANESATRRFLDLCVDLSRKLDEQERTAMLAKVNNIVSLTLDDNKTSENHDDNLHMRATSLNSRGYLALLTGDLRAAEDLFNESLGLREELFVREPNRTRNARNLAAAHDSLGDLYVTNASKYSTMNDKEATKEFNKAENEYRVSLELTRRFVSRTDASEEWKHDLTVAYFKLANTLFEADQKENAIAELETGFKLAREIAASSPDHDRLQVDLALYCLEFGRLHALSAEDEKARAYLEEGRDIFNKLRSRGRMRPEYESWLEMIKRMLTEIS